MLISNLLNELQRRNESSAGCVHTFLLTFLKPPLKRARRRLSDQSQRVSRCFICCRLKSRSGAGVASCGWLSACDCNSHLSFQDVFHHLRLASLHPLPLLLLTLSTTQIIWLVVQQLGAPVGRRLELILLSKAGNLRGDVALLYAKKGSRCWKTQYILQVKSPSLLNCESFVAQSRQDEERCGQVVTHLWHS